MRNKSILVMPLLATFLMGAGESGLVVSQTNPADRAPIDRLTTLSRNVCTLNVLGWIPTSKFNSRALLTELSAGAHGVTDVQMEKVSRNFLLLTQTCLKITATPYRWQPVEPPAPAPCEEEEAAAAAAAAAEDAPADETDETAPEAEAAPAAPPAPPVIVAILTEPPPKKAFALTLRLYKLLGKTPPEDEAAYNKIVADVWTIRQQNGKSDAEMILLTRAGTSLAGPEADLLEVLNKALEAKPKR